MKPTVSFFPVNNGDQTLFRTESGRYVLIDVNICQLNGDDDDPPDALALLKERLPEDDQGRPYVDVFLLSHPDQDHCRGLKANFHLGAPADYPKDSGKIFIREIWSSPIVFRRASTDHVLCDDAKAFNHEAKRRVARFRADGTKISDGDRILILGEDEDGKTDDLGDILVKVDQTFTRVNGTVDAGFEARLLAPLPAGDDDEEALFSKNHSSTVLNIVLKINSVVKCRFLTGGDAEVAIWERLWQKHKQRAAWLQYDILLTPHHCSWHSLSYDSWSELGDDAEVNDDARKALSQALDKAVIVASSKPISDDDSDPPCIRAKREYEDIATDAGGEFICVMENPSETAPDVLEFEITADGPRNTGLKAASAFFVKGSRKDPPPVQKQGGGRYA